MISIPKKTYDGCEAERVLIPEGAHLVEVLDVEGNDASEYLNVKYRTQLPAPGLEGEERFYLSQAAVKRLAILFKRAGLQDRGTDSGDSVTVDPYDLVGLQLVVQIEHEQRETKKGEQFTVSRWGYSSFWAPNHPEALKLAANLAMTRRAAPPTQRAPAPPPARPAAGQDDEV